MISYNSCQHLKEALLKKKAPTFRTMICSC